MIRDILLLTISDIAITITIICVSLMGEHDANDNINQEDIEITPSLEVYE